VWLVVDLWVIIPALNPAGAVYSDRVTGQFGGLGGFFKTAFTHPWDIVKLALGPERPWYLWQLLAPMALLSFFAPGLLLVAAGPLLSNLLSTFGYQHGLQYHYSTLIAPIVVASAIFGIARWSSVRVRYTLVGLATCAALVTGYLWGPLGRPQLYESTPQTGYEAAIRQAISMIPADAAVSTYYGWTPHLTHRERVYEFPNPWIASNWGMDDTNTHDPATVSYVIVRDDLADKEGALLAQLRNSDFEEIFHEQNVLLLRRI
jgi:uncharacterized membrane protein